MAYLILSVNANWHDIYLIIGIDLLLELCCNSSSRDFQKGSVKIVAIRKHEHNDNYSENDAQVTLDISPGLRRRIKRAVAGSDLSVNKYIEHILEQNVPMEQTEDIPNQAQRTPLTQEKLTQILQASDEIMRRTQGQVFEDPVDVIRKMRDERTQEVLNPYE